MYGEGSTTKKIGHYYHCYYGMEEDRVRCGGQLSIFAWEWMSQSDHLVTAWFAILLMMVCCFFRQHFRLVYLRGGSGRGYQS